MTGSYGCKNLTAWDSPEATIGTTSQDAKKARELLREMEVREGPYVSR